MDSIIVTVLIVGLMLLVLVGPELRLRFARKPRHFKKLVRPANAPQGKAFPGRRRHYRRGSHPERPAAQGGVQGAAQGQPAEAASSQEASREVPCAN